MQPEPGLAEDSAFGLVPAQQIIYASSSLVTVEDAVNMQKNERRWHHRRLASLSGRIVCSNQAHAIACQVQNVSAGGAHLVFEQVVELPREFVVEVLTLDLEVDARVVWSKAEEHGVVFIWPQHQGLCARA